jgi:curved DNA-binding protein CbpA
MARAETTMKHNGMDDDFYQVLNIPRTAAAEEIKQAYHRAARRHHPDKKHQPVTIATPPAEGAAQGGDERGVADPQHATSETTQDDHQQPPHQQQQPQSSWEFRRIQEAWECLGDSAKRLDYDRRLRQEQDAIERRMRNAIVLTSTDCRWEQQAAAAGDDDEDVHHEHHAFYQCRCGYDLALTMLPVLQDDLIACPGCSLIYDTAPLFDSSSAQDYYDHQSG